MRWWGTCASSSAVGFGCANVHAAIDQGGVDADDFNRGHCLAMAKAAAVLPLAVGPNQGDGVYRPASGCQMRVSMALDTRASTAQHQQPKRTRAVNTDQNAMLCAMGMAEPSFTAPSHKPVTQRRPPSSRSRRVLMLRLLLWERGRQHRFDRKVDECRVPTQTNKTVPSNPPRFASSAKR